ncbi:MAG: hypothetical protein Kow0010_05240 [Dehalococcoidia bacterium]
MLLFVWTIGIGILNGLDLVEFTRKQLLSHLHGGMLGWLTLGILGCTLWLFGDHPLGPRSKRYVEVCGVLAVAAVTGYVFAFATTFGVGRPLAGSLTLLSLVAFFSWAVSRVRYVTLTVPRLFMLVGLATSMLGGSFGVLNGLAIARDWSWVPTSFLDAHPATMDIGFVLPIATGLAEWGLRRGQPEERASRAGLVQAALMFIAFSLVLTFVLIEQEAMIGLATMLAVVGVVIFWVRLWPVGRRTSVLRRGPERHALMSGVFIAATLIYITVALLRAPEGDPELMPDGQFLAFIHMLAIGSTTNALLAFVAWLSLRSARANVLDDAVFWGVNSGVAGFATVLSLGYRTGIYIAVPVMGVALLLAIALHSWRLGLWSTGAAAPKAALEGRETRTA